jgi:predicted MFS family arabinose efflux permease
MFAMRTVVGAVLGIAAGWLAEVVLAEMAYPYGFGVLFGLAFGAMMISYVFLTLIEEGEGEAPKERIRYSEYLRTLPHLLRREKNFRNFMIGESILIAATMVEAFFAVDAIESFGLPESYAGRFTVIVMLSMGLGTLVCGYLADRLGHRLNFVLASLWMAFGCAAALLAESVEVYYLAFAGSALTVGLRTISRLPIIAEMCGEEDRPTFVALSNVLTAPFVLAGIAGGWAAVRLGYDFVFAGAGILSLASAVWFAAAVHEPRVSERGML